MEIVELDKIRNRTQERKNTINEEEIVGRLLALGLIGLLIAFSYPGRIARNNATP